MSGVCFKTTQGTGVRRGWVGEQDGSWDGNYWCWLMGWWGSVIVPLYFWICLNLSIIKDKQWKYNTCPKCLLQTSNIKLQWQSIWKLVHSVVWLSTPTLDSFQERATMVSINGKAQRFPPPRQSSSSHLPLMRPRARKLAGGGKDSPKIAPIEKVRSYQKPCSGPGFEASNLFSKRDIWMLGWESTGKQQEQLSPA